MATPTADSPARKRIAVAGVSRKRGEAAGKGNRKMETAVTVVGVILMLLGGWSVFIGTGGWRLVGSKYEDETSITTPITEVVIANPGFAHVDVEPATGTKVDIHRTVRWQPPFTSQPGQTYHVEGNKLFLDQPNGLSAVDYIVHVPTGVQVSR